MCVCACTRAGRQRSEASVWSIFSRPVGPREGLLHPCLLPGPWRPLSATGRASRAPFGRTFNAGDGAGNSIRDSIHIFPPTNHLSLNKVCFVRGSVLFVKVEAGCFSCEPAGKGVSPKRGGHSRAPCHAASQAGFLGR